MNDRARITALALSVAALFVGGTAATASAQEVQKERCYGINACKGKGDCSGKGHTCGGENECKGKGYINLPKGLCARIQGGRLTEEPAK